MQVHIWPSLTRLVAAANAAISVHASCVASCVGTGTVWKWSKTQIDSNGPSSGRLGDAEHGRPVVLSVDACQVEPPSLRHKKSKAHGSPPYGRDLAPEPGGGTAGGEVQVR